jgi:hypothetical protein
MLSSFVAAGIDHLTAGQGQTDEVCRLSAPSLKRETSDPRHFW